VSLLATTALIFAGVGMGNILVPPLVKKYFPDRLGLMLTLYTTAMALSTFLPPLISVPVADAAGWRVSLGLWGVFALAGVLPWMAILVSGRAARRPAMDAAPDGAANATASDPAELSTGPIAVVPTNSRAFARLVRLPMAWSIAVVFSTS